MKRRKFLASILCLLLAMHAVAFVSHRLIDHSYDEFQMNWGSQDQIVFHEDSKHQDLCLTCHFLTHSKHCDFKEYKQPTFNGYSPVNSSASFASFGINSESKKSRAPPGV